MNFSAHRLTVFILVFLLPLSFLFACSKKETASGTDTLVLKNGGKILCKILREDEKQLTVEYQGGQVEFTRAEIQTVLRDQQLVNSENGIEMMTDAAGSMQNYPYIRTTDGKAHFGKKMRYEKENFILEKNAPDPDEIIPKNKVEKIFPWPPADQKTLSGQFKGLIKKKPTKIHNVDPYIIYSDVESSDFVLYRAAIEETYHRFLTHFFELVDFERPPEWALGVIFYGKLADYLKNGGPPRTAGYFRPDDHVLRLYNVREIEMVQWVLGGEEKLQKKMGKTLSQIETTRGGAETGKWKAYDFIEKLQDAVEKDRVRIEQTARSGTMETIRHEGTHQVLNLFGVDRDFRGVWFSEGMADYLSAAEYNGIVQGRIMSLKSELESGHQLIPLDFMMSQPSGGHIYNFKDFHLTGQFYSQSWAFVHMLMNHYHDQFMAYMLDLKKQDKKFNVEKDKALFQKYLGKKLSELDAELEAYVTELAGQIDEEEYLFFKHASLRGEQQKNDFKKSVQNLVH